MTAYYILKGDCLEVLKERAKTCKTCLVRLDAIAKEELTRKNH